ncbi:MAG: hypothetical protein U0798_00015 [Gemmataceae bacterium]
MQLAVVSKQEYDKLVRENPKLFQDSNNNVVKIQQMTPAEKLKLTVDLVANGENRVISLPGQTIDDGRFAWFHSGEVRARVTMNTTVAKTDGKNVTQPGLEWINAGHSIGIIPKIVDDKKAVNLHLNYSHTTFGEPTELIPASNKVLPKSGEKAKEVAAETKSDWKGTPINGCGIESTVKLPTSTCSVLHLVNHDKKLSGLLFITTKVVEIPEPAAFVSEYYNAIAQGKLDEAKELAAKALAADPKCFAK